jgi:Pvc16 N-terminal domain
MTNALAIAAVTATLRNLLEAGVNGDAPLGFVRTTTQPPDKARGNGDNDNQLNLFLYQTTIDAAWRNMDMPRQVQPGEIGQPPLPLILHYLVTAYGRDNDDLLSHRVLGRAMSVLHDHPLLGAAEIRSALADAALHDQVERVRITPQPLSLEELSKLWTTFQTQYRISAGYQVAVVLIESTRPARTALPVLTQGPGDSGPAAQPDLTPPFPALAEVVPPNQQLAARIGDTIALRGFHLDGSGMRLRFTHPQLEQPIVVTLPAQASPTDVSFTIAGATDNDDGLPWRAGLYVLSAVVSKPADQDRVTNDLPFAMAPTIEVTPANAAPGTLNLTVTCSPPVQPGQRVALLFGDREIAIETPTIATGTLNLSVPDVAAGIYYLRLRVDGVDSLLVNRAVTPPVFFDNQKVTVQ